MAGRYLVTGVQLGMLVGIDKQDERKALVDKITDKQFVGNSSEHIENDVDKIIEVVAFN